MPTRYLSPVVYRQSGTGSIDVTLPDVPAGDESPFPLGFDLLYVRIHFTSSVANADLLVSLVSDSGEEYNVDLYTYSERGSGKDVHLVRSGSPNSPSPWSFQPRDRLRFTWSGDGEWGLEIGIRNLSS